MAESKSGERIGQKARPGPDRAAAADRGMKRTDYSAGADGTQHVDATEAEGCTPQDRRGVEADAEPEDEVHRG